VLFVDDAHLLDDASATLIHQLAYTDAAFVLVTVRTGEPAPDPIVALWKDGITERMELGGLTAESIEELLPSILGGPVDPAAAVALAVHCQGNVLFLRELVAGSLNDHALCDDGGIWRLTGSLSPSERLIELVQSRLRGLTQAERAFVELLSFGEPLGSAEVDALADPNIVEGLERKGLVSTRIRQRRLEVRLGHPIYGDVVRGLIPAVRARRIARTLAEVVEATGARRREDTLRIATWRLSAGGGTGELLLAAAATARWRYDFPLAERLARAAIDAGAGFAATLLLAQVASLRGGGADVDRDLSALAAEAKTDSERCLVAHTRVDHLMGLGCFDEARQVAEDAEATITDPAWRTEISARRSHLEVVIHGPKAGAASANPLLEHSEGKAFVWACITSSYSMGRMGRLEEALCLTEQGHFLYEALSTPLEWYPGVFSFFRCELLTILGRLDEAEALARLHHQQALTDRSTEAQAIFAWALMDVERKRGRLRTATRLGYEAVALFRQLGRSIHERDCLCELALTLASSGEATEAAELVSMVDALDIPLGRYRAVDLLEARAWVAMASGDMVSARSILEAAADLGEEIGDLVTAASVLHDMARLGLAKKVKHRLERIASDIDGSFVSTQARHAKALASSDPEMLEEVSAAFETMGAMLLAAEASANAAESWRRHGSPRAAGAEERSATLAAYCEGARPPTLRLAELRVRLTRAEQDAALLAANGKSNKEIAAHLSVSVRTVETQLQHVYTKFGISSRTQLAGIVKCMK
jgi:DNA-binding CsgD family transcriptional regulator